MKTKYNQQIGKLKTSDFDFDLPEQFIAQKPCFPKDHSKLMIFDTNKNIISHKNFYDLPSYLSNEDILVVNRSKVIPARVLFEIGKKIYEIFILKKLGNFKYKVLVKPGKYFKHGKKFKVNASVEGTVEAINPDGTRIIKFSSAIEQHGQIPLPPYINNPDIKFSEYQTIYSQEEGSVAAPTAGLHFTNDVLNSLKTKGVSLCEILLHVGRGTFLPVKTDNISEHTMHSEYFEMSLDNVQTLNKAKQNNKRIIAVGTTSVRVLESTFENEKFTCSNGETDIFIYPGNYNWKCVDALITNFHLPKSTLIMLVASFLEHKGVTEPVKKILEIYELAKNQNYRFYSFGDAMFIF